MQHAQHATKFVDVHESPMEVLLFRPDGEGPYPGIILAMHIPGHNGLEHDTFTLKTAERLAENGYFVVVPFIFHWWPKSADMETKRQESRDDWTVADLKAAYELLISREEVDGESVGIVGHCWGGRVAWLGACHIPELKVCAVFYGGNIKTGRGEGSPAPIGLAGNIQCPVIGFFGNEDKNPSPEDVDDYDRALAEADVPHVFHRYDGAGHAFQAFPMAERYREEQSEDAWDKLLGYLNQYLRE